MLLARSVSHCFPKFSLLSRVTPIYLTTSCISIVSQFISRNDYGGLLFLVCLKKRTASAFEKLRVQAVRSLLWLYSFQLVRAWERSPNSFRLRLPTYRPQCRWNESSYVGRYHTSNYNQWYTGVFWGSNHAIDRARTPIVSCLSLSSGKWYSARSGNFLSQVHLLPPSSGSKNPGDAPVSPKYFPTATSLMPFTMSMDTGNTTSTFWTSSLITLITR